MLRAGARTLGHGGPVRQRPIPPALGDVFPVGEALAAGVSRKRLRGNDLQKPFHGIRSSGRSDAIDSYVPLLRPGDRFSHTTAAQIWGAPIPGRHDHSLHVTASRGTRPRSKNCVGHLSPGRAVLRRGYPVSDPAQLMIECAALLRLDEVVAIADYLLLDPRILDPIDLRPYALRDELEVRFRSSRAYGVRRARQALRLARAGVESPMETRLRLLLGRAGLPEPVCGYELRRPSGRRVGWFDLAWPDRRVIAEYDGDEHRTSTVQYERDIRRFDDAADLGWRVIRVRRHGIRSDATRTVARVRDALTSHVAP